MSNKYLILFSFVLLFSCSKKHQPQNTNSNGATSANSRKVNSHGPLPKMLTVEDKIASKSVDGRLYFDLEGHRYWKNYNDGKYYMFNKSMYNNPAFKPH